MPTLIFWAHFVRNFHVQEGKCLPVREELQWETSTFYKIFFLWIKKQNIFWNDKIVRIQMSLFEINFIIDILGKLDKPRQAGFQKNYAVKL